MNAITVDAIGAPAKIEADLDFEALYRSSRDDVYAYVETLVSDRAAAEDVTATAFERAFRRRRDYDPKRGEARAWLFRIARNAALDELRRRKRRARLTAEPVEEAAPVETEAELSERRLALKQAVAALPGPDRELIALRFFVGLSMAEIGATLGISESNAGTRTHRALEKLRRAYDGDR